VVGLLLVGCATTPLYWYNNNPSANWNTDLYECTGAHSTTITSGGGTGLAGAFSAAEVGSVRTNYAMRDLCLKSRGWYQAPSPAMSTPPSVPPTTSSAPAAPPPASRPSSPCPAGHYWHSAFARCEKVGG
jgi:hypothetical protein